MLIVDRDKSCLDCLMPRRQTLKNKSIPLLVHLIAYLLSREFQVSVDTDATIIGASGTSFFFDFPAAHGLKVHDLCVVNRGATSCYTWFSTHAALVSYAQLHNLASHFISQFRNSQPTMHGAEIHGPVFPWITPHAALGPFEKKEPRRSRRDTLKKRRHAKCSPFYLKQISTHEKSPKTAQGMIHTLTLAPLGFWHFFFFTCKSNQSRRNINDKKF